jgi:hypothetical protein
MLWMTFSPGQSLSFIVSWTCCKSSLEWLHPLCIMRVGRIGPQDVQGGDKVEPHLGWGARGRLNPRPESQVDRFNDGNSWWNISNGASGNKVPHKTPLTNAFLTA